MYYQQDWIMRQIEEMIKFIRSILGKGGVQSCFESGTDLENESLKSEIENLIRYNRFEDAESIIFERIDRDKDFDIGIAFWFYENINSFSDVILETSNFSRKRILEGIKKACRKSKGIDSDVIDLFINPIDLA